jgi:hypothetical protein
MSNYYTTQYRNDGFGAQFQNIIFDILYTYANDNAKNTYVFPNIDRFEHNYNNDPDYTNRLIRYMNLKDHFGGGGGGFHLGTIHRYTTDVYSHVEDNISKLITSETMKLIKSLFYADKSTPFDTRYHNVAVHVRRPNPHDCRVEGTNDADSYYLNVIRYIRKNHTSDGKPLRFHIYSQGDAEAYDEYMKNNDDTVLDINEDVLLTFHSLVFADTLVTSASSFSYTAALLSNGAIYYKDFWHKPADSWIVGDTLCA